MHPSIAYLCNINTTTIIFKTFFKEIIMKTTIKFFAALLIFFTANTLQAQNTPNECVEVDMQVVYSDNDDNKVACYDVYVYTSETVDAIHIDGSDSDCTNTDVCIRTLCFPRASEAYEVFIGSQISSDDNQNCKSSHGSVVTIAP